MLSKTVIIYSGLFLRKVDKRKIRVFLESSPLYPNLLSVLQTFRYIGLETHSGRCDWDYLSNLDSPFLLHINNKHHEALIISRWNPSHNILEVLRPVGNIWESKNKEDIINAWDGVVIYTDAIPVRYVRLKKNIKTITSIGLLIFFLWAIFMVYRLQAIYAVSVLSGLIVSIYLYCKNFISPIFLVDKICHLSSVVDCDAVEKSKYGNLGGLGMECMALSYFLSQLSCIVLSCTLRLSDSMYTMCLISAILIIPVTMYSVYGQWSVRKICPLCLLILLCVIIQAAMFFHGPSGIFSLGLLTLWAAYAICYLCLFTLYFKNRMYQHENLEARIENLKLKRSKEVLLMKSSSAEHVTAPISLGVETSRINLTTIISPSCTHCRKIVSYLFSLTEQNIEFRWNIILGQTAINDSEKIKIWIQSYIYDKNKFIQDLHLWGNGRIQNLSCKSVSNPKDIKADKICHDNDRQLANLHISGFPQIILNDRLLSPVYSTEDLELMIIDQINIMTS